MLTARQWCRSLTIFLSMAATVAWIGAPAAAQPSVAAAPSATVRLSPGLPLKRDDAGDEPWRAKLVWGVVLLGAVAATVYVTLRRAGQLPGLPALGRAGDGLRRRAHLQLSQQASVHIVHWDGTDYLLGVTAHQVTLLTKTPQPAADSALSVRKEDSA